MKLADYKKQDAWWEDEDGASYEDVEALLMTKLDKFCGCGRPHEALVFIRAGLRLLADWTKASRDVTDHSQWDPLWAQHKAACDGVFHDEKIEWFFWYWLDARGLTEHGGSVPGWLNEKGVAMLALLDEWFDSADRETD